MFLDQIIQPDSAFFKSWNEIKKSLYNKKGPIPLWYKHMINHYTLNSNNLRLNFELPHLLQQTLHVKRPKKDFNSPNQTIRPRNSWAHFWSPSVKDTTYGKILSKDNHNPNSPMMIMEHWIPCPIIDNSKDTRGHTPNSRPNFLQPCEGCSLHYPYYIADLQLKCILFFAIDRSLYLKILNNPHQVNDNSLRRTTERHMKKRVQTTQSHHSLRTLAYNDYLRTHQILDIENHRTSEDISLPFNLISNRYPSTFLHNFFLLSSDTVMTLFNFYEILVSFSQDTTIEIYTDGACNLEQRQDITMGIRWHITQPSTPLPITFSGSCKHFPSSTKAEAYAICTALLICPSRSKVHIYTDSLCCINTFHTITKRLTTPRRQLKIPNHNIWFIIAKIIAVNSLTVQLHKVKAHSGNQNNDKADILAKAGFTSTHSIEINRKHLPNNIQFIWDQHQDNIVVDQNVRHITRDIGNRQKFNAWLDYTTNTILKQASFNQQINWSMTEEFFKFNPHDRPTSHKLTKFRAWQRKTVNNLLPTMDVLYRQYPTLFKDKRSCWTCN
ncbi:hypothetical protein RclHR1_19460001 [Rhizophagus clarus]|uniref:ribonuclease H n=1 Tax=Rhizophagus clarus TaxID=94130 RepID=A0A2Z6R1Q9_9GLOM|nr:hypothetical protein RclHR1_19460001 [Rhizophagus clarus]GES73355.1 ribonuclease H-like domain-containing protein [Rhizophagus clarus]